jgi:hypothetical protein
MKTTYYVEDPNGQIVNYYQRLHMAKEALIKLNCLDNHRIVCLKGQYQYEGTHAYYLRHNGKKFYKGV